jgi:hypothetical protein
VNPGPLEADIANLKAVIADVSPAEVFTSAARARVLEVLGQYLDVMSDEQLYALSDATETLSELVAAVLRSGGMRSQHLACAPQATTGRAA